LQAFVLFLLTGKYRWDDVEMEYRRNRVDQRGTMFPHSEGRRQKNAPTDHSVDKITHYLLFWNAEQLVGSKRGAGRRVITETLVANVSDDRLAQMAPPSPTGDRCQACQSSCSINSAWDVSDPKPSAFESEQKKAPASQSQLAGQLTTRRSGL
jgi:hypothetical protein